MRLKVSPFFSNSRKKKIRSFLRTPITSNKGKEKELTQEIGEIKYGEALNVLELVKAGTGPGAADVLRFDDLMTDTSFNRIE